MITSSTSPRLAAFELIARAHFTRSIAEALVDRSDERRVAVRQHHLAALRDQLARGVGELALLVGAEHVRRCSS